MSSSIYLWLLFASLMAFGLHRRLKRTFGRQPVRKGRMIFRMVMLTLLAGMILLLSPTMACLSAAGAGATLGIGLAIVGLAYTHYEVNETGKFYTSNGWIGMIVTTLFLGRMAARLATISSVSAASPSLPTPFSGTSRNPLTMAVFVLMASYYVSYYAGVLRTIRALADKR
jgi:hypothetical protein